MLSRELFVRQRLRRHKACERVAEQVSVLAVVVSEFEFIKVTI